MRQVKIIGLSALAFCIAASLLVSQIIHSAEASKAAPGPTPVPSIAVTSPGPTNTPVPASSSEAAANIPVVAESQPSTGDSLPQSQDQTRVSRIKITLRETLDVTVASDSTNSALVVSPEIASAEIKAKGVVTISALKLGETMLIISDGHRRFIFIVEVVAPKPAPREQTNTERVQRDRIEKAKTSGTVNIAYSAGFDGTPSLVRQRFDFRHRLSDDKTLRASGEISKTFGNDGKRILLPSVQSFGLNRLTLGVDSSSGSIDLLDSQVHVSPLSLNGVAIRGFHLISNTGKSWGPAKTPKKGMEIFAGIARPSFSFYDDQTGKLAGVTMPIASGRSWQVRSGFVSVTPNTNHPFGKGGTLANLSAIYEPNDKLSVDTEMVYSNGKLSWRAKLNLRLRQFRVFGEIIRLDKNSPLNSIGAQQGGRKTEALAFDWRPDPRFSLSTTYNQTTTERPTSLGFASTNRSAFAVNSGYRVNKNLRFTLRFREQQIEARFPGTTAKYEIGSRTVTIGNTVGFSRHFSNSFEAQFSSSRETKADSKLEGGFTLSERLSYSSGEITASVFATYAHNTPSLSSFVVRNPYLLPPALQNEIMLDPAQFLQVYRDRLAFLLPGIELPLTRNLNTGLRIQKTFSRFTLSGETRYHGGEISSQSRRGVSASAGVNMRLDAANALRVNANHTFGTGGQSAVTLSFTHQFGAGGGGFKLSRLFRSRKGTIMGRVYHDLNGNGRDDITEPGIPGVKVHPVGASGTTTDATGRYRLSVREGSREILLESNDLGVKYRPSTPLQSRIIITAGGTSVVSFGLTDVGSVGGRIVNGLGNPGEPVPSGLKGIAGVRVLVRDAAGTVFDSSTTNYGSYAIGNLRPGHYSFEVDPTSLPANFRFPAQTSWTINVDPLTSVYFDIPIESYRAVAGIVFIDKNGNGRFNLGTDVPVEGATVMSNGSIVAISGANGAYIVRNLAAGRISLNVRSSSGKNSIPTVLDFAIAPEIKRVDLAVMP